MMYKSALLENVVKVDLFSAEKCACHTHATWYTSCFSLNDLEEREWNECGQNKYPKPVTNSKARPMPNLS